MMHAHKTQWLCVHVSVSQYDKNDLTMVTAVNYTLLHDLHT